MIKFLLLTILLAFNAWSMDRLDLELSETEVHQGALIRGKLIIQPDSINLPVQKLKGATIADTLYFQQLSPPLKRDGSASYEVETKIIFIKSPESETLAGTVGQNEILINVGGIKVIPVEATGQMLWADFSAPDFLAGNWRWVWISLFFILLAGGSYFLWQKISSKRKIAARRKALLGEFRSCSTYEDIVDMWKKKRIYLQEFPQIEKDFGRFEDVLFRYQFKPHQSESEKKSVEEAYRKLLSESEGELRGI